MKRLLDLKVTELQCSFDFRNMVLTTCIFHSPSLFEALCFFHQILSSTNIVCLPLRVPINHSSMETNWCSIIFFMVFNYWCSIICELTSCYLTFHFFLCLDCNLMNCAYKFLHSPVAAFVFVN